jgi:hypothetical protein
MRSDLNFQTATERAKADRNLTANTKPFAEVLKSLDLEGMAILELGCGRGDLLRRLRHSDAKTVYAFELNSGEMYPDILAWARDEKAVPRLILNPKEAKIDPSLPDGDFTNYDFTRLLEHENQFSIIGNPPYFLWNRVLSLTGEYLAPEDRGLSQLREKFAGALAFTSASRICNHPGWIVRAVSQPEDFTPPPLTDVDHCLVQTGFEGRCNQEKSHISEDNVPTGHYTQRLYTAPQRYVHINNRSPEADRTDHYPGWGNGVVPNHLGVEQATMQQTRRQCSLTARALAALARAPRKAAQTTRERVKTALGR